MSEPEGPPRPGMQAERDLKEGGSAPALPLDGVQVLDFSRLLPGPWCTQFLSDLGASVIKVEMPRLGDLSRYNAPRHGGSSIYFELVNGGKKGLSLNLACEEGRHIADRLITDSDVVVESFRPGAADKLGIGYGRARELRPDIIYCSITGFGQSGPLSHISGHDLVIQSLVGYMPLPARSGMLPPMPGFQAADYAAASVACTAILAALMRRQRDGAGCFIDLPMFDSLFSMCNIALTGAIGAAAGSGDEDRLEAWGGNPRYAIYGTRDGKSVAVALLETRLWAAFCDAIGRPDLMDPGEAPEARHSSHGARSEQYRKAIAEVCASRDRDELVDWMARHGVPVCPVYSPDEALASPNVRARGLVQPPEGADGCDDRPAHLANPLSASGLARPRRRYAPGLGADNAEILGRLGYDEGDLEKLRERGVIG